MMTPAIRRRRRGCGGSTSQTMPRDPSAPSKTHTLLCPGQLPNVYGGSRVSKETADILSNVTHDSSFERDPRSYELQLERFTCDKFLPDALQMKPKSLCWLQLRTPAHMDPPTLYRASP